MHGLIYETSIHVRQNQPGSVLLIKYDYARIGVFLAYRRVK
ncbi:hypothetical protein M153_796000121, partial [Pseudoloma neurophilia]